jgi:hypothetical protein
VHQRNGGINQRRTELFQEAFIVKIVENFVVNSDDYGVGAEIENISAAANQTFFGGIIGASFCRKAASRFGAGKSDNAGEGEIVAEKELRKGRIVPSERTAKRAIDSSVKLVVPHFHIGLVCPDVSQQSLTSDLI